MTPRLTRAPYGVLSTGETVDCFTLINAAGAECRIITYGATVTVLSVPDRDGVFDDVVLGYDDLAAYEAGTAYFGAIAGRFANRIARGQFSLGGHSYQLATNNGSNHLHGGVRGFDRVVWSAEADGDEGVRLSYVSSDGEEGYPGTLRVEVRYTFTAESVLRIEYRATTDRATVVNLTNHSYFNLRGEGDILGHLAQLDAMGFTPSDDALVPTGEILPVEGGPMDFRTAKPIGRDFAQMTNEPRGVDHNFAVASAPGVFARVARVSEPATGRSLEVWSDQPGVQFYTGNFLGPAMAGKGGAIYRQHAGFCLETQHFPDSPNQPTFPSTVLRPGETFRSATEFRFSAV